MTRALTNSILPGIRRKVILEIAQESGMKLEQRAFSVEEAKAADEAFISSATTLVLAVVRIDGQVVGNGKPGPVAKRLRELYVNSLLAEAAQK